MSRTHLFTRTSPFLLATLLATSCSDGHAAEVEVELEALPALAQTEPAAAAMPLPEDAELAPWRVQLLELAADTAGAIPAYPHLKTQAQLQQDVVEVCVELDQPRRALACTQRIGNWRRGVGYADLASWLAEQGIEDGLDELVAIAEVESRLEGEENPQDWQRDLIRSKLAVALLKLGRVGDAAPFEYDLEDSEVGRVAAAKASLFDREELDQRLAELDAVLPAANLDQMRSALLAALHLYERGIDDAEWRRTCEDWMAAALAKVPAQVRLETYMDMARASAAGGFPEAAKAQMAKAREVFDAVNWLPEDKVPLLARVAAARHAAGDSETARAEVAEALALFHETRESIQDFWRGAALRPLAEAFVEVGEPAEALRVYRVAAEEGTLNPNARTRCEDLVANCLSMVRCDVQPDAELLARLRATRAGLEDPW